MTTSRPDRANNAGALRPSAGDRLVAIPIAMATASASRFQFLAMRDSPIRVALAAMAATALDTCRRGGRELPERLGRLGPAGLARCSVRRVLGRWLGTS